MFKSLEKDINKYVDIEKIHQTVLVAICFSLIGSSDQNYNKRGDVGKVYDAIQIDVTQDDRRDKRHGQRRVRSEIAIVSGNK